MNRKNIHHGTTLALSIPVTRPEVFSHRATADVLAVLADNPDGTFGIREMSRAIDRPHRSVSQAVEDLAAVDLVRIDRDGPKKLVGINRDRLEDPTDPVLAIPQSEFHEPVRDLLAELETALEAVAGIVLFGSVARGQADRRSDIDCFVLVAEGAAIGQQTAHEVVETLHDRRYDGHRYTFQVLVESTETATQYGERLRTIFAEGITLRESDQLRTLKQEVLADGQ